MAQGYDLPGPPSIPTLDLVSLVSCMHLAVSWAPPQTGLGHLFPDPTCFFEGTDMNRTGAPRVNTAQEVESSDFTGA